MSAAPSAFRMRGSSRVSGGSPITRRTDAISVTAAGDTTGNDFTSFGAQWYAITPAGHYHFEYLHEGWDKGKLGKMWNPYYFNGGIAVHGYTSVPTDPASHGCARIPMHIAEYFHTLVKVGDPVYVFGGAPAQILSSVAIGPPPTAPTTAPAATPPPAPAPATPAT